MNLVNLFCEHFVILSNHKFHSHLKSIILQVVYLLKDNPGFKESLTEF